MVSENEMKAWKVPLDEEELQTLHPGQTLDGTSGVYLLLSEHGEETAVFKPMGEEYLPEEATTWGLETGEGMKREQAAFLLSEALAGFPGVPYTSISQVNGQVGCAQRFVPNCIDMSDLGPNGIPDAEVQKLAMMDLMTFNIDRHEGNILLKQATKELIPIDHAQCLPELVRPDGANQDMLRSLYFAWQTWPQAKAGWTEEAKKIVSEIAAEDLAWSLNAKMGDHALSETALTSLKAGAIFLKTCVAAGLCASEIAELVREKLGDLLDACASTASAADGYAAWETVVLKELRARTLALLNIDADADASDSDADTVIAALPVFEQPQPGCQEIEVCEAVLENSIPQLSGSEEAGPCVLKVVLTEAICFLLPRVGSISADSSPSPCMRASSRRRSARSGSVAAVRCPLRRRATVAGSSNKQSAAADGVF